MDYFTTKAKHERATHEQLEEYVAFCQAHPEMGTGKNSPKTPQKMRELCLELADILNSCRGPIRPAAKWKDTLGVWKSQLRTRARRLKMSQRLTGGGPSLKPMCDFEEKAAVDGVNGIPSFGLTIECLTLPASSAVSPLPLAEEYQDASTSQLSRGTRNMLIRTLIADIAKRNTAEDVRRQEHREMMLAIQALTNSVMEFINSRK